MGSNPTIPTILKEMKDTYDNYLNSERTVENEFMEYTFDKFCKPYDRILDVGGVPTNHSYSKKLFSAVEKHKGINFIEYEIADYRDGNHVKYMGDFCRYDFKDIKFEKIIFLSSLEHFPFCVGIESQYKEGQDIVGYKKALSILNENGLIFLTVPFGKYRWQAHHQNYDWNGIKQLTEGSEIIEHYTYRLSNDDKFWNIETPETMDDILYTDKAHGVGCFVLKKI